jgi:hypothetical protein
MSAELEYRYTCQATYNDIIEHLYTFKHRSQKLDHITYQNTVSFCSCASYILKFSALHVFTQCFPLLMIFHFCLFLCHFLYNTFWFTFPLTDTNGTTVYIRNFPEVCAGKFKFVTYTGNYGSRYKPWPWTVIWVMVVFNLGHLSRLFVKHLLEWRKVRFGTCLVHRHFHLSSR